MYKIIGGDQKEYGPVSADQLRHWIRDGRLNAHTQARLEPGGEWQPLSSFPEFADALGIGAPGTPGIPGAPAAIPPPPPASFPVGTGSREAALNAVKGPAIALIVVAAVGLALFLLGTIENFMGVKPVTPSNLPPQWQAFFERLASKHGPTQGMFDLFFAAMNGVVLFAGIKMMRLESHTFVAVACVLAMLPITVNCCCLLGLPFGIWGLIVLNKPEVKSHFT